jgi:hypothetical protein
MFIVQDIAATDIAGDTGKTWESLIQLGYCNLIDGRRVAIPPLWISALRRSNLTIDWRINDSVFSPLGELDWPSWEKFCLGFLVASYVQVSHMNHKRLA